MASASIKMGSPKASRVQLDGPGSAEIMIYFSTNRVRVLAHCLIKATRCKLRISSTRVLGPGDAKTQVDQDVVKMTFPNTDYLGIVSLSGLKS